MKNENSKNYVLSKILAGSGCIDVVLDKLTFMILVFSFPMEGNMVRLMKDELFEISRLDEE